MAGLRIAALSRIVRSNHAASSNPVHSHNAVHKHNVHASHAVIGVTELQMMNATDNAKATIPITTKDTGIASMAALADMAAKGVAVAKTIVAISYVDDVILVTMGDTCVVSKTAPVPMVAIVIVSPVDRDAVCSDGAVDSTVLNLFNRGIATFAIRNDSRQTSLTTSD